MAGETAERFAHAYKLVSFDVFDTVLTRAVSSPSDIHELVGNELGRRGWINITGPEWRQFREAAEDDARRQTRFEETTLQEIYTLLAQRLELTDDTREHAMALEIETETRHFRPIAETGNLIRQVRQRRRRVAFVANTCLPGSVIEAELRRHSLMRDGDLLLVSSEHRAVKQSGDLIRLLTRASGVAPDDICHLGDNRGADYESARDAGLHASWYQGSTPTRYEAIETSADSLGLAGALIAGSSRATRLSRSFRSAHERVIWEVSTGVAGPLLCGFVLWCLQQAQDRGLPRLYFLARDGQILAKLAEILAPRFGIPVEARYLHVSRRALLGPVLDPGSPDFAEILARLANEQTLGDIAACLEVSQDRLAEHLPADLDWLRSGTAQLDLDSAHRLAAHIAKSPLASHLTRLSKMRREAMLSYLRSQRVLDEAEVGIVDVGWRGSQQVLLERALAMGVTGVAPSIVGFYLGLSEASEDIGEHHVYSHDRGIYSRALIELLCAADHGTTEAYEEVAGIGRPVLKETNPEAAAWGVKTQHEGICSFAATVADAMKDACIGPAEAVEAFHAIGPNNFFEFARKPSIAEAETYGRFRHSPNLGHATFPEVGAPVSVPFLPLWFLRMKPARSTWGEGSFRRSLSRRWSRLGTALLWMRAEGGRKMLDLRRLVHKKQDTSGLTSPPPAQPLPPTVRPEHRSPAPAALRRTSQPLPPPPLALHQQRLPAYRSGPRSRQ